MRLPHPVRFQRLDQELQPVARYLSGRMLNAGSGSRDITNFLRGNGVTDLTLYDISSDDPSVILGPIESMEMLITRLKKTKSNAEFLLGLSRT